MQTKNVKQSKRWFKGWTGPKLGRLSAKLPRRRRRMRKYNAFELKVFMAGLMIFDHLDHIPEFLSPEVAGLFHVLTRCVGVWFAYAAVESSLYTRSRLNYIARIFLAAAGMALGNLLLNRLGEEAELWFKTDDSGLFRDTLEQYLPQAGYRVEYLTWDLHQEALPDNVPTEHEEMFAAQGIPIKFLRAKPERREAVPC